MKTRLSVVFAVAALFGATYAQDNPPETVDELDINLYLGLWYQMFANLLVNITFERDAFCVTADYLVLLLGPETFRDEGLYEYAVVSNERRGALFVIARDVPGFRAEYQEEVLAWLANNGFDGPLTEPLETYQEQDCEDAPAP